MFVKHVGKSHQQPLPGFRIVTPMHNFTVPAALKLWIDHVLCINRSFSATPQGKVGSMKDRPTFVLVSSGGFHVGERARQADFLTPYFCYALASIGINNVHFLPLQGLVFGPEAVAQVIDDARRQLFEKLPLAIASEAGIGGDWLAEKFESNATLR